MRCPCQYHLWTLDVQFCTFLLDGDDIGKSLKRMYGSCLHSNNRLTAIFHKLVYYALGIVELSVLQSCKRAYGNDVAIARHYRNCLQQVFALVAIHDNSTLCLQFPCSCIYVQHYNVHTEVHGSLLCAQACAQAIVEEYHEQSLVFAQLLITETVCFHFQCFGNGFVKIAEVFYVEKCLHICDSVCL